MTQTPSQISASKMAGGGEYEDRLWNVLRGLDIPHLTLGLITNTNDNTGIDLPLEFYGDRLWVEAKMARAQMGGTSAHFDREMSTFTKLVKRLDDADLVLAAAQVKIPSLNAYIDAVKELEPESTIRGVPFTLKKTTRTALGRTGRNLQAAAEGKFHHPIEFLRRFYNSKGMYYIQIQGAGFFSLGGNPFHFPIPELEGTFRLETRIGYGGSGGSDRASAGYRIQGRLINVNKSEYTLENPDHCRHLFSRDWRL
jgi:hypothetical protein